MQQAYESSKKADLNPGNVAERRAEEDARRLLASVVESSADGIVTEDLNAIVTTWNRGAERMFGYSAGEIIGRSISLIIPFGNHYEIPGVLERIKRAESIEQYETVRKAKSGNLIDVSITWSPLYDTTGRIIGASKVMRDITERKQMEEQRMELLTRERALAMEKTLRETQSELARVARMLSMGELATLVAHEINQPLTGIITNAEAGVRWLSGESPNLQEARESLRLIVRDGNRASAVIRRIRELLKKDAPQSTQLNIAELVQEVIELTQKELKKRDIRLYAEIAGDLPSTNGDRVQLQQVLLNLIMNAAEAMGCVEGPKELLIRSEHSAPGHVVVSVRDCGIGINPQDVNRIFDPLFTTKPTGMGLGLSLSRSIVASHGGRISARLNDGPGLTVEFTLPAEGVRQNVEGANSRYEI